MDGNGKRVLVVDDHEPTRLLMRLALERAGYDVGTSGDGLEALHEVLTRHVDVVITDFAMPTLNGLQLLGRIHGVAPGTPVILVSGSPPDVRPSDDGAAFFASLRKPFDVAVLLELVGDAARAAESADPKVSAPAARTWSAGGPRKIEVLRSGCNG